MYNHNKAQQSKNRVHMSWDILYLLTVTAIVALSLIPDHSLQETKLEYSPPSSHYQCGNYDCYFKSLRRNPDQLPSGGVSIYIKKGLYHHQVQMDSHLQAVAVQVTLGDTPVTILSVYIPSNNHLTSRDLTYLTRNIRGQILITGDFNGHSCLWGSHDVYTRGEVIERFTDKHNLYILNDGTHTYLKPQAKHANKPTSAIDLTISTPGLALRSVWEVLPDTHGRDHYPILTSILPSVAEIQPSCDPSHWVFSKANWEQFHDACLFGKHLSGYTRGSRSLALLCRAHNQGHKWLHP